MANNIAIKITADVADFTAKRAVLSAELKAATKDLNAFANQARTGGMTDQLRASMLAAADTISKFRGKIGELNEEQKKLSEHGSIGKALDNIFDRSRLAVIEEGTAKIPLFGSAIEALGPGGIAAAAAMAALAFGLERTAKAVEFAAGISKLGKEVGVSTDFLQKFNFAARQNEIDVNAADGALKKLNESLGLVQAGLARKQTVNAFAALLGVDPADVPEMLRQYQNVGDFFPVLAERISNVGNAAERAAIAKRLGIEELLPMLNSTGEGFAGLARKAEELGIVMNSAAIEKASQAKEKLTELDDVMKGKANITFVEFSNTLIKIKEGFLAAETAGLRFLAAITGTEATSVGRLTELRAEVARLTDASGKAKSPFFEGQIAHDRQAIAKMEQELAAKPEAPKAADKVAALVDTTTTKGPSAVAVWTEQLHQQEVASGDFFKDETARELAFWQSKLSQTSKGSKDWLAVQAKIYEAQKVLAHQSYDDQLASLNERLEADKQNWTAEQAVWNEKLDFIKAHYGAESRQYKDAYKEFEAAERQHQEQMAQIARTAANERVAELQRELQTMAQIRKADAQQAVSDIGQKAKESANPLAEVQAAAEVLQIHRQMDEQDLADLQSTYAAKNALLQQSIAEARTAYGEDSNQYAQAQAAKAKADAEFYSQHRLMENQMVLQQRQDAQKVVQAWHSMIDPVIQASGQGIRGMIEGTETLTQALAGVGEAILDIIITAIERWVAAQIVAMVTGQAVGKTAALSQIASSVAMAGAGGVASMAAAPFPLDLTAPAFGASMAAAAASFGALASFDVGTNFVPNDMVAQIHQGERIIPAADNKALMDAVSGHPGANPDAGGSGGDTHHHWHVYTMDGPSFEAFINRPSTAGVMRRFLQRQARDMLMA